MMMNYQLAKLGNKPKGTIVVLPPIEDRLSAVIDYRTALRVILRGLAKELRESIIPLYSSRLAQRKAAMTMDDLESEDFNVLKAVAAALTGIAERTVRRILKLEADWHTKRWKASVQKAIGIDLAAVVREDDLSDTLRAAGLRNAALIKGFSDETLKRVQRIVADGYLAGQSATKVRELLKADLGVMGRRAELIASDQMSSLNADLNRMRHEQAGITEYEWMSSADERVRPLHRSLNGKKFKYGKPTGAEQGLPPGKPIRCRCVARAVVVF